jgi:methyl-accepting chemotaxis protein
MEIISTVLNKILGTKASILREKNSELTAEMNALNEVLAVIEFSPEGLILTANQNFLDAVGYWMV